MEIAGRPKRLKKGEGILFMAPCRFKNAFKGCLRLDSLWVFTGVMGRLVPLFFIPVVKSLRPHYIVGSLLMTVFLIRILAGTKLKSRLFAPYGLSLVAWFCFIGVAAVSFINLPPMQVLLYPRAIGYDSLIVKWFLLMIVIFLCVYYYDLASSEENTIRNLVRGLDIAFIFFLLVGWPLYLGVVLGYVPQKIYFLFTLKTEMLDPITRFCPGDYANGTGEMLGFYIVFLVLMRRHLRYVPVKFLAAFAGLLLTMTRAAIIPAGGLVAFFFVQAVVRRLLTMNFTFFRKSYGSLLILLIGTGFLTYIAVHFEDVMENLLVLYSGIVHAAQSHSVQQRLVEWNQSFNLFVYSTYMGTGFGTRLETHNVVIQLLAEVGLIGTIFYVIFVAVRLLVVLKAYINVAFGRQDMESDFIRMVLIAIPTNILFALTNHNLFHFTFWFLAIASFVIEARMDYWHTGERLIYNEDVRIS